MGLPIQTSANMSAMCTMLSSRRFFHDENVVREIQSTIKAHPCEYFMDATPQVVFDDESWMLFKSALAKQAKQRKKENAPIASKNNTKLLVRSNNRDVSFERIQLDNTKKIVRICKSSYEIVKYENFNEIKKMYNKTEVDEIYNVLTGETESSAYYWTQN
jgi:hypothetical protein